MRGSRGAVVWLVVLLLAAAAAATQLAHLAAGARREAASERALARARAALLAYAAARPIGAIVGPGYLPCPDLDGDGWAEPICGPLDGSRGNAERLGLLPWKTLGLDELRDGHGAPLWYAVAAKHKGLLNCAASAGCVDMSPTAARGTITVRDPDGTVTHDGTLADASRPAAAAVVIAPGPPLMRAHPEARTQHRAACAGRCDPRDYLDAAPSALGGEDNASFTDRLDAGRAANSDGFIRGPVRDAEARLHVNDRVLAVGEGEVMQRVMRRVALEAAHCLRYYASRPENGGRYPWPAPACGTDATPPVGRVPDTPFAATLASSGGRMLPQWWRGDPRTPERLAELPIAAHACRLAVAPADAGPERSLPAGSPAAEGATTDVPSWWEGWKPHVFYAPAAAFTPGSATPHCADGSACITLESASGEALGSPRELVVVVSRARAQCSAAPLECGPTRCTRARLEPGHEIVALP